MQKMLLQTDGPHRILLFPAWPPTLSVAFKLGAMFLGAAGGPTTVEASYDSATKAVKVSVTPPDRMADIVILLPEYHLVDF